MPDRDLDQDRCPVPDTVIEEAVETALPALARRGIKPGRTDLRIAVKAVAPVLFEAGVQAERERTRKVLDWLDAEDHMGEGDVRREMGDGFDRAVAAAISALSTGEDCPECGSSDPGICAADSERGRRPHLHGEKGCCLNKFHQRPENGGNDE